MAQNRMTPPGARTRIARKASTSPMSAKAFAELGGKRLVYVRSVQARDVMDELVDEHGELMFDVEENQVLYAVHTSDGQRVALVGDRALAFASARQYEMNPVSAH